jgi:hypothetical protein
MIRRPRGPLKPVREETAAVLGMLVRQLGRYEQNLVTDIAYFLGFRKGDPVIDWRRHYGPLEAAVARLPPGWQKLRKFGWVDVVRAEVSKELRKFVCRVLYPRTRDKLLWKEPAVGRRRCGMILPRDAALLVVKQTRCCVNCAKWNPNPYIGLLMRRLGGRTLRRIYAAHCLEIGCAGRCAWVCHLVGCAWRAPKPGEAWCGVIDACANFDMITEVVRKGWVRDHGGWSMTDCPCGGCSRFHHLMPVRYLMPNRDCVDVIWGEREEYPHDLTVAGVLLRPALTLATFCPSGRVLEPYDHAVRLR